MLQDGDSLAEALHHRVVEFSLEGGGGGQHSHGAGGGALSRRFDGWFHAHEGRVGEPPAQVVQRSGGGCVASHDDQLGAPLQQVAGDAFGQGAHLCQGARSIRDVRLVRQIDDVFLGLLGSQGG